LPIHPTKEAPLHNNCTANNNNTQPHFVTITALHNTTTTPQQYQPTLHIMYKNFLTLAVVALFCIGTIAGQTCSGPLLNLRTYDGTCNNLVDPSAGSSGEFYRRGPEGAAYGPGNTPINRGVERVISNKIARADPSLRDSIRHSLFATQFGQFVNHDLDNNLFVDPNSISYPDALSVPETNDEYVFFFFFNFLFSFFVFFPVQFAFVPFFPPFFFFNFVFSFCFFPCLPFCQICCDMNYLLNSIFFVFYPN